MPKFRSIADFKAVRYALEPIKNPNCRSLRAGEVKKFFVYKRHSFYEQPDDRSE